MTIKQFFTGRAIVLGIILAIFLVVFAYKTYLSPVQDTQAPVPAAQQGTIDPSTFAWRFEKSTALNLDGIPKTAIFLDAAYDNGTVERTLVDTVDSSCNELPDAEKDSVAGSKNIQCYGAGLGFRFKITKGESAYLVQRKMFEEGTPDSAAPVHAYEVVSQIPFSR